MEGRGAPSIGDQRRARHSPESDSYETIAGLLIEKLRHIPDKGEVLTLGPLIIEVVAATDRAIESVRITRRKK